MMTKICSRCKIKKSLEEFAKNRSTKDGHTVYCRPCWSKINTAYETTPNGRRLRKKYNQKNYKKKQEEYKKKQAAYRKTPAGKLVAWRCMLKRNYGMTAEQYNLMLDQQGGVCACCGSADPKGNSERFRVDHCHKTGKVRGLLCNNCNQALGLAGDCLSGVMKLVEYLKKAESHRPRKLNKEKAKEIRRRYFHHNLTQQQLADLYGVTQAAIGRIVNNITYKEPDFGLHGSSDFSVSYNYIPK